MLYTKDDFLKVIPEFLSPDENRRILADNLFYSMITHNQKGSSNDATPYELLRTTPETLAEKYALDAQTFIEHVIFYLARKIIEEQNSFDMFLGDEYNSTEPQPATSIIIHPKDLAYPITNPMDHQQFPMMIGMVEWLNAVIQDYPETLSIISDLMKDNELEFCEILVRKIRDNHAQDELFQPLLSQLLTHNYLNPSLIADLINDSATLQIIALQSLQEREGFYDIPFDVFNQIKQPTKAFLDKFYHLLSTESQQFNDNCYADYLLALAKLSAQIDHNCDAIRALILPLLAQNDIEYSLHLALQYIVRAKEDQALLSTWIMHDQPWRRYGAYLSHRHIQFPNNAMIEMALSDSINDEYDTMIHDIAIQTLLYWHDTGINLAIAQEYLPQLEIFADTLSSPWLFEDSDMLFSDFFNDENEESDDTFTEHNESNEHFNDFVQSIELTLLPKIPQEFSELEDTTEVSPIKLLIEKLSNINAY